MKMAMNPTTIQQLNRQQQGLPSNFARSVPGQSLTQPPGKYQWEKPARISSVEDALPKIMKSLNQPTTMKNIIMLIDAGVSIESIVRGITFNGFVEGEWTPDVAEMLNPILLLEVLTIANYAGLDDIRTVNSYPDDEIKSSKILEIMRELNPKKYERRRDEALQQKQMLVSEKEQEPLVEDGSFMAVLEAPEAAEEMPVAVDSDMPVASFVEQMPVEEEEEEELV